MKLSLYERISPPYAAAMTLTPHDLPVPADAVLVDPEWTDSGHGFHRGFNGTERTTDAATVGILGTQHGDGRTERWVSVDAADSLGAGQARQLAAALLNAADEMDGYAPL